MGRDSQRLTLACTRPVNPSTPVSQVGRGSALEDGGCCWVGDSRKTGSVSLPSSGTTGKERLVILDEPTETSSCPDSGVGNRLGQSAHAIASRILLPRENRHPVASNSTSATIDSPITSGSGSTSDDRRVRLSLPRVTRQEPPSVATSESFTTTPSTRADGTTWSMTRGCPRIATSSSSGPDVNVKERASSTRWSLG